MTESEEQEVCNAAEDGLNRAVNNWTKVGHLMRKAAMESINASVFDSAESLIPGHPLIIDGRPKVDEFLALVVDMRNSSKRLKSIEHFAEIESGFQRVYYETSTLLPALAKTALLKNGHVTEYLGDGVLILFQVDTSDRSEAVKEAYRAAKNCVTTTRYIVNTLLHDRFELPAINIGAGLSMSQALVTLIGLPGSMHPKAIGQCVWEASKLSGGVNTVHVAKALKDAWPTSKGGKLQFRPLEDLPLDGFRVIEG